MLLKNGEAVAVLLDTESYQSMQKALGLLKIISLAEKDIRNQKLIPQDDVFNRIEKKFMK